MESNTSGWYVITTTGTGTSDNITVTTYPGIAPSPTSAEEPTVYPVYPTYPDYPVYPTFPYPILDPEKEEMRRKIDRMEKLLEEIAIMVEKKHAI